MIPENRSTALSPTPEQSSIIEATSSTSDSLMISSYAGTAKSTTLEMLSSKLRQPTLALAFNKKIADDLRPRMPPFVTTKTLNSFGFAAWTRANPSISNWTLDDKKIGKIINQLGKDRKISISPDIWSQCRSLISKVMQAGIVPGDAGDYICPDLDSNWISLANDLGIYDQDDIGLLIDIGRDVLVESISQARLGKISFDDQIYCSTCLGGIFPRFPVILGDEAQDWSPLNHQMVSLASDSSTRFIVAGDPLQSIYAFRGADAESMSNLRKLRETWNDQSLTLTFRCPKVVVERQQRHAPGFRAFEKNASGQFIIFADNIQKSWIWNDAEFERNEINPAASVAVLCRNNAPLLALAFKLIRQRVAPYMLGRDIGKGLSALSRKILPEDSTLRDVCVGKIEAWMDHEISLARINDHEEKIAGISDRGECLLAVLESGECRDAGDLRKILDLLFSKESGQVVLSTIHRAKGLEWDVVLHLDPWRIPSKQSKKDPRQLRQEMNLLYVCETRTRHTLINANLGDFQ